MPDLISFLTDVALRSSLILAVIFVLLFVMSRASASERHLVMLLGLLVVALIPVGLLLSPKISWKIPFPQQAEVMVVQKVVSPVLEEGRNSNVPLSSSAIESKFSPWELLTYVNGLGTLLGAGMLVQIMILGRVGWSWWKVRRQVVQTPLSNEALDQAQTFAGKKGMPPIFISDQVTVPMLAGWLRPAIILPVEAHKWPAKRLSMVLCHELAHFKRGDAWILPLHWLLRILYWWHPMVWLALARLRRERENACDDLVLNQNFRATDYADLIVFTARQMRSIHWQNGALAMASPSHLGERIRAILDPSLNRRPASRTTGFTGLILAFSLGWLFVAANIQAEDKPVMPESIIATNASEPQIKLSFKLVEIDEKTYLQKTKVIDEAVKNGNMTIFYNMPGASLLSAPSVTTDCGIKASIGLTKKYSIEDDGDSNKKASSPIHDMNVGVEAMITPSLSADGKIRLTWKTKVIGVLNGAEEPEPHFYVNGNSTRNASSDKWAFWINDANLRYNYSLIGLMNGTGDKLKLSDLKKSPNRLALFITAHLVQHDVGAAPVPAPAVRMSPAPSGPGPRIDMGVTFVEIEKKMYEQQAQAMDKAVKNGDVHFFDNREGVAVVPNAKVRLAVGKPGWFSNGKVFSYVSCSVSTEKKDGVAPTTTLTANAVFIGVNADFTSSVSPQGGILLDSSFQVTEMLGYDKLASSSDRYPKPEFRVTTFKDKNWKMAPGKEHGFWVSATDGSIKNWARSGRWPASLDEMIKSKSPSRLAVFMHAEQITSSAGVRPTDQPATAESTAANGMTHLVADDASMVPINPPDPAKTTFYTQMEYFEIDEKTYAQKPDATEVALKKGDISFFRQLGTFRILAYPAVYTKVNCKAVIQVLKPFSYPDKFVRDNNGKFIPSGKTNDRKCGITATILPSLSADGKISLGYTDEITMFAGWLEKPSGSGEESPIFNVSAGASKKLALADGKPQGLWVRTNSPGLDEMIGLKKGVPSIPSITAPPVRIGVIITASKVNQP